MLTHALLRLPGANFAAGLTQAGEGAPDPELALEQHRAYCEALSDCGLSLTVLPADPAHPDGCFVEDTALVTERGAIVMRPGAPSRRGEADVIEAALKGLFPDIARIRAPGTVDAGDVCEADGHFLIGLSARTNEAGAAELAQLLEGLGYRSDIVDIRRSRQLLHLKTGIAYLGEGRMLTTMDFPPEPALASYQIVARPQPSVTQRMHCASTITCWWPRVILKHAPRSKHSDSTSSRSRCRSSGSSTAASAAFPCAGDLTIPR